MFSDAEGTLWLGSEPAFPIVTMEKDGTDWQELQMEKLTLMVALLLECGPVTKTEGH